MDKKKQIKFANIVLLVVALFSLFMATVTADNVYQTTGTPETDYRSELSNLFRVQNVGLTFFATATQNAQHPFVGDIDGNGTLEILHRDNSQLIVRSAPSLDILASGNIYQSPGATHFGNNSNGVLIDIDSDGRMEYIMANKVVRTLFIYEFNGTSIVNESQLYYGASLPGSNPQNDVVLGCDYTTNECGLFITNGAVPETVYMAAFNATDVKVELSDGVNIPWPGHSLCMPSVPTVAVGDYDGDGDREFMASWIGLESAGDENVLITIFRINDSLSPIFEREIHYSGSLIGDVTDPNADSSRCEVPSEFTSDWPAGQWISSPLIHNIDADGKTDILIAVSNTNDNYHILGFNTDSDTAFFERWPQAAAGNGALQGNLFLADIMLDTNNKEVCGMGYNGIDQKATMLCANPENNFFGFLDSQKYDFDAGANITNTHASDGIWRPITHVVDSTSAQLDGINADEILTSYGVLAVTDQGSLNPITLSDGTLQLIWPNPRADTVIIPVDAQNTSFDDFIAMSPTNIMYFDDQFVNLGGQIIEYCTNPSFESTWKINTTVQVAITVDDVNSDDVSARAIFYNGGPSQQDSNWSANTTHGTTFNFNFIANQTGNAHTIRMIGRDVENPNETEWDVQFQNFGVALNGAEFGDSSSCDTFALQDPNNITGTNTTAINEQTGQEIKGSVSGTVEEFGAIAGVGTFSMFLIIMALVVWGMWHGSKEKNPVMKMGAIGIILLLMIIIGAKEGLIDPGVIITIVVIGIIALSLMLRNWWMGSSSN